MMVKMFKKFPKTIYSKSNLYKNSVKILNFNNFHFDDEKCNKICYTDLRYQFLII